MQELGYNYRLTDIQAALGISQVLKLKRFLRSRSEIANRYQEAFRDFALADTLFVPDDRISAWHLFPIFLNLEKLKVTRRIIVEELHKRNIFVQVHYIPVYKHPYYRRLGYENGLCPKAEEFYEQEISIPVYPLLKNKEQDFVIRTLRNIISKYTYLMS